jgi:enterochelin esterase-like enzyme
MAGVSRSDDADGLVVTPRPAGTVRQELASGGPAAVLALARASRGPVVEQCGPGHYDVTFVFPAPRPTPRQVGLFCPALPGGFVLMHDLGDGVFASTARLPGGTRVAYHFCLDPPAGLGPAELGALARSAQGRRIDYLNPDFDQVSLRGLRLRIVDSLLALPGSRTAPATRPQRGTAAGSVEEMTIASAELGRRKEILIYSPAGPAAGTDPPLVLLLQGNEEWQGRDFLDNLIASGQVRPFAAVVPSERSVTARLRDFTSGGAHSRFITAELWPALASRGLARAEAVVAGYSAGALAATWLAADEPGMFPRLAAISGAFHLRPAAGLKEPSGGPAPVLDRFRRPGGTPRRAYLAAGWYEDAWEPAIYDNTAQLARVLRGHGAEVRFDSGPHGHDTVSARACLAEGLRWLLGPP